MNKARKAKGRRRRNLHLLVSEYLRPTSDLFLAPEWLFTELRDPYLHDQNTQHNNKVAANAWHLKICADQRVCRYIASMAAMGDQSMHLIQFCEVRPPGGIGSGTTCPVNFWCSANLALNLDSPGRTRWV
jgi:hypothetical protein